MFMDGQFIGYFLGSLLTKPPISDKRKIGCVPTCWAVSRPGWECDLAGLTGLTVSTTRGSEEKRKHSGSAAAALPLLLCFLGNKIGLALAFRETFHIIFSFFNKVDTTNRCEALKEVMSLKYVKY